MFEFFADERQTKPGNIRLPLLDADSQGSVDGDNQDTCDSWKTPKNPFEIMLMSTQSENMKQATLTSGVPLSKTIQISKTSEDKSVSEKIFSLTTRPTFNAEKPLLKKLNPKEI